MLTGRAHVAAPSDLLRLLRHCVGQIGGGRSNQGDDTMKGLFDLDDLVRGGAFLATVVGTLLIIGGALAIS